MGLHGLDRNPQLSGDLFAGISRGHQPQHLSFTGRQRVYLLVRGTLSPGFQRHIPDDLLQVVEIKEVQYLQDPLPTFRAHSLKDPVQTAWCSPKVQGGAQGQGALATHQFLGLPHQGGLPLLEIAPGDGLQKPVQVTFSELNHRLDPGLSQMKLLPGALDLFPKGKEGLGNPDQGFFFRIRKGDIHGGAFDSEFYDQLYHIMC